MPSLHFIGEVLPVKQYTIHYPVLGYYELFYFLNNQFFFIFIVLFLFGVFFLSFSLFFSYVHIYVHVSLMFNGSNFMFHFHFHFHHFFFFFSFCTNKDQTLFIYFSRGWQIIYFMGSLFFFDQMCLFNLQI